MNIVAMDVFSRLMMDRIIFLGTGINDQVANIVQAQLLFLESTDASKDIQIYINSPGGGVYAGLDRKSTRLNSSHVAISYAVFCLTKIGSTRCAVGGRRPV